MNSGWKSSSCCSSSASWKCNGNEAGDVLHSFTAHVTKLAVITFIVGVLEGDCWWFVDANILRMLLRYVKIDWV